MFRVRMITDFVSACGRSAVQPTVTPATGARRNRMRPAVDGASAKRWANVEAIRQMRTARVAPPTVAVARAHRHEGGEGEIEYEVVEQAESVGAIAEGRQAVHDARQAPPPWRSPGPGQPWGAPSRPPSGCRGNPATPYTGSRRSRRVEAGAAVDDRCVISIAVDCRPQELELKRMGRPREGRSFFPMMRNRQKTWLLRMGLSSAAGEMR